MQNRRGFLMGAGFAWAGLVTPARNAIAGPALQLRRQVDLASLANDEAYWATVRKFFRPDLSHAWFNCFANNPCPSPVYAKYIAKEELANAWPMANLRKMFNSDAKEALRSRLASLINASAEEIALMRNTTEALSNVIFGLELSVGDEVIVMDHEYGTFLDAWAQREKRDHIVLRTVKIPMPVDDPAELVGVIRSAMTSRTRVVMCSHVSAISGQIFPVRAIADIAHKSGAQVIVDGALSFGVIPVDVRDLDCDYFATSLHKGVFAPTGTGFLYVRKSRIHGVWPLFGAEEAEADDIRKFEHRGTAPVAAFAAVPDALDFHQSIGLEALATRYRYLKQSWAERVVSHPRCRILVSLRPEHSCGITLLAIDGVDPVKARKYLFEKRALSVWPSAPWHEEPLGLWVSPYPWTSREELDHLVAAILEIADHPDLTVA